MKISNSLIFFAGTIAAFTCLAAAAEDTWKPIECSELQKLRGKISEINYSGYAEVSKYDFGKAIDSWTQDDMNAFKAMFVDCRKKNFFSDMDVPVVPKYADRLIAAINKGISDHKKQDNVGAQLEKYAARVSDLSANLDDTKAQELSNVNTEIFSNPEFAAGKPFYNQARELREKIVNSLQAYEDKKTAQVDKARKIAQAAKAEEKQEKEANWCTFQSFIADSMEMPRQAVCSCISPSEMGSIMSGLPAKQKEKIREEKGPDGKVTKVTVPLVFDDGGPKSYRTPTGIVIPASALNGGGSAYYYKGKKAVCTSALQSMSKTAEQQNKAKLKKNADKYE